MLKKIIGWLGWAVLGLVMAAVAFVIIAAQLGWEFDAVLSGSMEPEIGVGGLVVIKPMDGNDVSVGDVISFKLPGIDTPICHRVIERTETPEGVNLQTKGDANEEPDEYIVQAGDVNGKAVFYLPYAGYLGRLSEFGRTRVHVLGVSVPAAALFVTVMGLVFIVFIFKDAYQDLAYPEQKIYKEMRKKRESRRVEQYKALNIKKKGGVH
ncbi:MAG: signal peptidase I [Dehalococcoidales bacterium]|nr:signal peptidase I [Dehalococcoidales bacterium]